MTSDPSSLPLVVLVHGAWHGAWCWAAVQAELDGRGIASLAVDLPGHGSSTEAPTGLHGDAAALTMLLDRLGARGTGPIVLVGHSYGGAVITRAASGRDDIASLVYVAAFALLPGESVLGALGSFERHDVALSAAMVTTDDGTSSTLDPAGAADALYNACPPEAVAAALPRLCPQTMSSMIETVDSSPLGAIASAYVVCTHDRAVHPEHQAVMALRCDERHSLDADHSPFISAVAELTDLIEAQVTR